MRKILSILLFAVLFLPAVCFAEVDEWKYKLIIEHGMEVKCTQVLNGQCITHSWRDREDNNYRILTPSISAPDPEPEFEGFEPGTDGIIRIPVVACRERTAGIDAEGNVTHNWEVEEEVWLRSLPEAGVNVGADITIAPMIGCNIKINQAGNYILWIKGEGPDASSDSVNYGVNGVRAGAITFLNQPWSKDRQSHTEDAILQLSEGTMQLNIWMREDSTRIMIIELTTDPSHVPSDADYGEGGVVDGG